MKKIWLILIGILLAAGAAGFYIYNKPYQNMSKAKPAFELSANELFTAFETDEVSANEKFLDQIIQVSGTVIDTKTDEEGLTSVTLNGGGSMFGIICKLDPLSKPRRTTFSQEESVTFKGICSGMLMDVVLVRCVEVDP